MCFSIHYLTHFTICVYEFHHQKKLKLRMSSDLMSVFFVLSLFIAFLACAYNNIWLFRFYFFPFCFRSECFCTWTNSIGKMVGWIEYNNRTEKNLRYHTTVHTKIPPNKQRHTSKTQQKIHRKQNSCAAYTPTFQVDCNWNRKRIET